MPPPGVLALTTADRQALIPMAAGYLILMSAFALGLYRLYHPRTTPPAKAPPIPGPAAEAPPIPGPAADGPPAATPPTPGPPAESPPAEHPPPRPGERTGRAALARRIASTVIGGYLLLMVVIVAYYYGVAKVGPGFLEQALSGTALLLVLAAPVFAALSWLAERRSRS